MASPNLIEATDANFDAEILKSATPALVDFWAAWCAPCRAIAPSVEALAEEHQGKLKVAKLNIDQNPQIPTRYGIRGIPTLLVFKDGKVVDQVVGAVPKAKLDQVVKKALAD